MDPLHPPTTTSSPFTNTNANANTNASVPTTSILTPRCRPLDPITTTTPPTTTAAPTNANNMFATNHYHHHHHHPLSACASPATSTDSSDPALGSPTTTRRLPGLQFAIAHRRPELRLPVLQQPSPSSASAASAASGLHLSMAACETPHYLPGVPTCPETSPAEKQRPGTTTTTTLSSHLDEADKKRKKGTRRGTLNAEAKNVLKAWMFSPEHFAHPYPSEEEKEELANEAGIEVKQLSNWFTNARKRLWQPVLRQSGVEVKNFLSTGRGGPRGNKLDIPPNLQHLIAQRDSPPSSPVAAPIETMTKPSPTTIPLLPPPVTSGPSSSSSSVASFKRTWAEMQSSPAPSTAVLSGSMDEVAPTKKRKTGVARKKSSSSQHPHEPRHHGMLPPKDDPHALTKTATQLSHELRLALQSSNSPPMHGHLLASPSSSAAAMAVTANVASFQELEILAAASLIGLHQQQQYQSVH